MADGRSDLNTLTDTSTTYGLMEWNSRLVLESDLEAYVVPVGEGAGGTKYSVLGFRALRTRLELSCITSREMDHPCGLLSVSKHVTTLTRTR